jgi:voltage-gated potassium channel
MRDIILFGYGKNAKAVAKHLDRKSFMIVVFDEEEKNLAELDGYLNVEYLKNDIVDKDLVEVGIKDAKIAICMLNDEARNMFLALSIRGLSKTIKIIAKALNKEYAHRYKLAGVDQIINSYEITANRIKTILKKPITLELIHNIVFKDSDLVFSQVNIKKDSFLDGKRLNEAMLEEAYNLIVIGILDKERSDKMEFIGHFNHKLDDGDILVVVGDKKEIERLNQDMEDFSNWKLQ